jgi:hypothetical protein
MALNTALIGKVYPTYRYEVSREKIRDYAFALGETDPRYFSDGDDCVAPPTFTAAFTVIRGGEPAFSDPELGAHKALVHGAQRFTFGTRALVPGDVLECVPHIAGISARGENEFLELHVTCTFTDSGALAVRSEATIVFLGSAPKEGAA